MAAELSFSLIERKIIDLEIAGRYSEHCDNPPLREDYFFLTGGFQPKPACKVPTTVPINVTI